MTNQRAEEIWRKNLSEYSHILRLDAIIMRTISDVYKESEKEFKKLHNVNEWFDVETFPNVDYWYLVFDQDLCMITKALFDGEWHMNEDNFNVTHWMELPKPPLKN